ncbi:unnamed protein product [Owenia fusiformis]|uniref:L-dopachrome isomerase n=1 Tax=Owenia fusiformis TaxID=6347 RepID=A0A8J1TJT8_OWEFU|nr:unnamed protein product [Owenia fusiformis]
MKVRLFINLTYLTLKIHPSHQEDKMPLAVVRTNLNKTATPKSFLADFTDFIVKTLGCDEKYTMIEMHTDVPMMRAGTTAPMLNLDIHHADDQVTDDTKRELAAKFAEFLVSQVEVPIDRILVLFFDSRQCTSIHSITSL